MGKPALQAVEADPAPVAFDTPARASLGAAIENHRLAVASLEETRATMDRVRTARFAARKVLAEANRALGDAKATTQARSLASVRETGTLVEDRVLIEAEAAVATIERNLEASQRTSEMLETVEREALYKVSTTKSKLDEAAMLVTLEALPALVERGVAAQTEANRVREIVQMINSNLRFVSDDVRKAIFALHPTQNFGSDPRAALWAQYMEKLREDATVAAPD